MSISKHSAHDVIGLVVLAQSFAYVSAESAAGTRGAKPSEC